MDGTCPISGCVLPVSVAGLCDRHYLRKRRLGDPLAGGPNRTVRMGLSAEDRLWASVDRSGGPESCWEWSGTTRPSGYGQITVRRHSGEQSTMRVHRLAYMICKGQIPAGMFVCHSCDNRRCCNPAHLWLGTPKQNTSDMFTKGRDRHNPPKGEACFSAKVTEAEVMEMRLMRQSGIPIKDIASKFGICRPNASRLTRGLTWKSVPLPASHNLEAETE